MSDSSSKSDPTNREAADLSPVTVWLHQLEAGDAKAAQSLYEHFCSRLQALARQRIPARMRSAYDQDDAANSAFYCLFHGIREHRYQLKDRMEFWRLLLTIAKRKVAHRIRDESRDKRDMRRVVRNMIFEPFTTGSPDELMDDVQPDMKSLVGPEPTPEFAAEVAETCDALLASLPDDNSRQVALLRLENHTADEIADKLGCSRRTVQRKLLLIRRTWQQTVGIENSENE